MTLNWFKLMILLYVPECYRPTKVQFLLLTCIYVAVNTMVCDNTEFCASDRHGSNQFFPIKNGGFSQCCTRTYQTCERHLSNLRFRTLDGIFMHRFASSY